MSSKLSLVLIAVVVTHLLTSLCVQSPAPHAFGGTVDSSGEQLLIATGKLHNVEADALYILDERTRKLAIYLVRTNRLELHSLRDCGLDFQLVAFGEQSPTLKEVKKALANKKS